VAFHTTKIIIQSSRHVKSVCTQPEVSIEVSSNTGIKIELPVHEGSVFFSKHVAIHIP